MPQNRTSIKAKNQKNKYSDLENNLFTKINLLKNSNQIKRPRTTFNFQRNYQYDYNSLQKNVKPLKQQQNLSILQKAKKLTNQKKSEIDKIKRTLKKSKNQTQEMFLTGCGLYKKQEQQMVQFNDDFEAIDMDSALNFLVSHQKDDLAELRKMIKVTNYNLKQYSNQIYHTQNQVVDAADKFGKQINIDLKVKISKCGLQNKFQPQFTQKRKILTSHKNRSKIHSFKVQI